MNYSDVANTFTVRIGDSLRTYFIKPDTPVDQEWPIELQYAVARRRGLLDDRIKEQFRQRGSAGHNRSSVDKSA